MDEIQFKPKKEFLNTNKTIETFIYLKKDYLHALEVIENQFTALKNNKSNKHKCNRDIDCPCIYYGKLLADLYLANNSSYEHNLITFLNKYYESLDINAPYELLMYVVKALIKLMDFPACSALIENYILYSRMNKHFTLPLKKDSPSVTQEHVK
jgi:hypothetical protein